MSRVRPQLRRSPDDRWIAGVCSGLAHHLGVSVVVVRVAFVALAVTNGAGFLAYAALWAFLRDREGGLRWARLRHLPRRRALVALAGIVAGALVLQGLLGPLWGWRTVGPLTLAGLGGLLVWSRADDGRRDRWRADARRLRTFALERHPRDTLFVSVGVALVIAGVGAFLAAQDALTQARDGALTVAATAVGVLLVCGPWLLRLGRDLTAERRERIREQERADVAAHLHDSVLQTLALVQRNAADPTAVRRLARRQERELRDWLYGQAAAPSGSLSAALAAAAAEVEDATGVVIDLVTVGDVPLDDRVAAMVAAAREALLNAARHAGVDKVSAFAEVEDGAVVVYIRDRGRGFRPADVPVDRHGLRESVSGRVERAGGRVEVRSALGEGTEIALRMPRSSS